MIKIISRSQITTTVSDQTAVNWIFGFLAAFVLFAVLIRLIDAFQIKNQQRTFTGAAIASGIAISLNIAPLGTIASEITELSRVIPAAYPAFVGAMLKVETGMGLLWGLIKMYESGGGFAVISFGFAFFAGLVLPLEPFIGLIFITISWLLMEASPADCW